MVLNRGDDRIRTGDKGVADPCLTTWLRRQSDPNEIRTRVTAVKGRCLNRLTMGPYKFVSAESEIQRSISKLPE